LIHDSQPRWRRALGWFPEKITSTLSHRLLSQSEEDMRVAHEMKLGSREKISYLGNGVDIERFRPPSAAERTVARRALGLKPDEFAIGSVGRLVYEKGFAELFSAVAKIKSRYPFARFFVVGPEELDQRDAIPRKLISELAARGQVEFLGWRDDMAPFYAALDLFVLPSHREGIPRACMEAASSGLPVIASNIRGCREVVRDGESGLLFPVKSSEALAEAIAKLIADRPRAQDMGANGRRHIVQNFDERQVLLRLCSFYEELAEKIEAPERQ
jgi:glycosyltransferase involved in cell wall biosynthesis